MSKTGGPVGGVSPRVLNLVILTVVVSWVTSLVLDATGVWADPPETIGLAFMAILGPLVGVWAARLAAAPPPTPEGVERRAANELDEEQVNSHE